MATVKKYNLEGKEVGEIQIDDAQLETEISQQLLKDYLVAIRENKRQWSANTKGRSEISHSNAKPHPQKGTGRARQGTLAAPQFKGGGIVFGPKPKFDQHVKVNKKEKRKAIRYLLSQKIAEGKLFVLDSFKMEAPKTKTLVSFLSSLNVGSKRVMFLAESAEDSNKDDYFTFTKSMRNLPKKQFKHLENVNGYDLALNENVVVFGPALDELKAMLGVE